MTNTDALTLGDLDRDGALAESAERVGVTRGDALRRAVLGGGALVGGSALWRRSLPAPSAPRRGPRPATSTSSTSR